MFHRTLTAAPAAVLMLLAGCGGAEVTNPGSPPAATFMVSINGGYGAGTYAPGDTVYAFAAFPVGGSALTAWSGDAVTASLTEWNGRFIMPPRNVSLSVATASVTAPLAVGTFSGVTMRAKTYRYFIPANPRGLILAFHGTGGSNRIIERTDGYALTLQAVQAGYGVVSYDSEETVAGDLDGNGKVRWDVSGTTTNTDFANLDALIGQLRTSGLISSTLPLYAFGMSNGSAMVVTLGAIASQSNLAAAFPRLRFRAVAGYCAPGPLVAATATLTPTAWYLCRNDLNEDVGATGNLRAEQESASLAARGVPTDLAYNEPTPLYPERFTRSGLIDVATSRGLVEELRRTGYVDARGFLNTPPSEIIADLLSLGAGRFPAFAALTLSQQIDLADALRESYADHQLFSDQARRMLNFFNRF